MKGVPVHPPTRPGTPGNPPSNKLVNRAHHCREAHLHACRSLHISYETRTFSRCHPLRLSICCCLPPLCCRLLLLVDDLGGMCRFLLHQLRVLQTISDSRAEDSFVVLKAPAKAPQTHLWPQPGRRHGQ